MNRGRALLLLMLLAFAAPTLADGPNGFTRGCTSYSHAEDHPTGMDFATFAEAWAFCQSRVSFHTIYGDEHSVSTDGDLLVTFHHRHGIWFPDGEEEDPEFLSMAVHEYRCRDITAQIDPATLTCSDGQYDLTTEDVGILVSYCLGSFLLGFACGYTQRVLYKAMEKV